MSKINETKLYFAVMDYVGKTHKFSLVEASAMAKEITDSIIKKVKERK